MTDFESPHVEDPADESPHEAPDADDQATVDHDAPAERIVDPIDEDQAEGPKTDLTTDPDEIAEDEAESELEPLPSPHGEAAELVDPWVFDRWVEHYEIDARLNAIPPEDLNPAAARQAAPPAGIRP